MKQKGVGFASKSGTRKVRFTTGVFHEGVDYEDGQEADVNPAAAAAYVYQGRAVYVDVSKEEGDDHAVVGPGAKAGLDTRNAGAAVNTTNMGK